MRHGRNPASPSPICGLGRVVGLWADLELGNFAEQPAAGRESGGLGLAANGQRTADVAAHLATALPAGRLDSRQPEFIFCHLRRVDVGAAGTLH